MGMLHTDHIATLFKYRKLVIYDNC